MHDLAQGGDLSADRGLGRGHVRGIRKIDAAAREVRPHGGHPALEDEREGAPLGHRARGEILHELAVGREPLPLRALQAPLGREVRVGNDEPAVHRVRERSAPISALRPTAIQGSPILGTTPPLRALRTVRAMRFGMRCSVMIPPGRVVQEIVSASRNYLIRRPQVRPFRIISRSSR